jgi:hypothetical protein
MTKRRRLLNLAKRTGLTFLAVEGLQAAAVAGATRWAGNRLRSHDRRALRMTGQALTTAAALIPVARFARRRFA